jgi:hypothetical protein
MGIRAMIDPHGDPAATPAQFRFRYTGQQSAFWTVDQVRVYGS